MFLSNFIQQSDQTAGYIVDAATETTDIISAQPAAQTVQELSLWDLCVDGGWIMIVLAVLLIIAIYIFVERSLVINKAGREDGSFMKRIKDYIHDGEISSAYRLCENTDSPYSRLIAKGLSRIGRPMNDVLVTIENTGNLEVANLSKGLPWLATTAAGAPMLGFLGTVIGMVQSFYAIAQSGNSAEIGSFADGIYTALVTTVAGLIVGIIALFAYNYLVSRVNKVMNRMEARIMDFMDLLNEPANN
ncbi:MAG: MotA/TolQ/ExbB proton channel family protein [Muribaculaceae bacterium]|nr:MotA/TolQ/ExbB proton channel family protein [Muribaculaceae bacterium]